MQYVLYIASSLLKYSLHPIYLYNIPSTPKKEYVLPTHDSQRTYTQLIAQRLCVPICQIFICNLYTPQKRPTPHILTMNQTSTTYSCTNTGTLIYIWCRERQRERDVYVCIYMCIYIYLCYTYIMYIYIYVLCIYIICMYIYISMYVCLYIYVMKISYIDSTT